MTKKDKVLEHLNKYKSITSLEAIDKYGATRLSSIIFKLRKKGYNIVTEPVEYIDRYGNKTYYGKYILLD